MRPIQQVVRTREIRVAELKEWAEREANPLLRQLRDFANALLSGGATSRGVSLGGEWRTARIGELGADYLPDNSVALDLSDGDTRELLLITAPRTYTLNAGPASDEFRVFRFWKLDTSGNDVDFTAGADTVTLDGSTRWLVTAIRGAAAWSIHSVEPVSY